MGPSRRSRSSRPREAFQLPAGPSPLPGAPWAGRCCWRLPRLVGCGCSLSLCLLRTPTAGGFRRLLPSTAAAAPEKCPLGVVEGLSLLAAGPRGASGARP